MAGKDKKIKIRCPWAVWESYDFGELNPVNPTSFSAPRDPNVTFLQEARKQVRDRYDSDLFQSAGPRSGPWLAVVLKVLSGPTAANEATTAGQLTKNASINGSRSWWEEVSVLKGKTSPIRVIAKIPELTADLPWPGCETKQDEQIISFHPEFIAMKQAAANLGSVQPGSLIWVDFVGSSAGGSTSTNGIILSVASEYIPSPIEVDISPQGAFAPCSDDPLTGPAPGFYAGHTVGALEPGPTLHKIKNKIKTGVFGAGSIQTKSHFFESLVQAPTSYKHNISGPAPAGLNSFLWVGNLRQNGYLDIVDRPYDQGRETIIYAPKMLDVTAPIELIYYFHDTAGFGFPWIHGPETTKKQAIAAASIAGNDFREKIAPQIKDLDRDGRNYVLVIPEMSYSRGFGTAAGDSSRIEKYSKGRLVQKGVVSKSKKTVRSYCDSDENKKALGALKSHLSSIKTPTPGAEDLLSVSKTTKRIFSTFDGSYTGGDFVLFHQEVVNTLKKHIHANIGSKLSYITLTADGAGAVALASLVIMQDSGADNAPSSLEAIPEIRRINFITNGEDKTLIPYVSPKSTDGPGQAQPPSTVIHDLFLKFATQTPLEFNYIMEPGQPSTNSFFKRLEQQDKFAKNYKPSGQKFSFFVDEPTKYKYITLHVPEKDQRVSYAFNLFNNFLSDSTGIISNPRKSHTITLPGNTSVPDHAATLASKTSDAAIFSYNKLKSDLEVQVNNFEELLTLIGDWGLVASGPLLGDNFSPYFKKIGDKKTIDLSKGSYFSSQYSSWLQSKKKIAEYEYLSLLEADLKKVLKKQMEISAVDKTYIEDVASVVEDPQVQKTIRDEIQIFSKFSKENFPPGGGDTNNSGIISTKIENEVKPILVDAARLDALKKARKRVEDVRKKVDSALSTNESKPNPAAECISSPIRLSTFDYKKTNASGRFSSTSIQCDSLQLSRPEGATAYQQLVTMIPFYPKKEDYINKKKNEIEKLPGYKLSGFVYLTRKKNNQSSMHNSEKDGVKVWSCLRPVIEKAWQVATRKARWTPFKVTHGFRAKAPPRLRNGVSLHSYGLAIDIDPCLNGYDNKGELTATCFTNAYLANLTQGSYEALHALGVYNESVSDIKNAVFFEGFGFDGSPRTADQFKSSPFAYKPNDSKLSGYLKTQHNLAPISPPNSNPLDWVITFCETSGMIWGNGTFLKKRYRGGDKWSGADKQIISELLGIPNVVDRVQEISWDSNINDYMHFQWWKNKNVVSFEEIAKAAEINGEKY